MTKKCSKCGIEKELSEFRFRKDSNTYYNKCKICMILKQKLYNEKNKEKIKLYREKTKEKIRLQQKLYREKNKEKIKLKNALYNEQNKKNLKLRHKLYNEKNKEKKKLYREQNKEKIKLQSKLYKKNKLKNNINFKLSENIRSRIRKAIKNQYGKKTYGSIELLGCTIEEARTHLESKFKPGMSWENHGMHGWHIDHIIPCSVFNLTDPVEQKQCFHYTNLQPLWAEENMAKSDKIIN